MKESTYLQITIKTTVISIITIAILLLFSVLPQVNTKWIDGGKMVREYVQFSDLFFRWHEPINAPYVDSSKVYVVDVNEYQTREELTNLFNAIADDQPYLVAMDLTYSSYAMMDSMANQRLIESIKRLPNLIVAEEVIDKGDSSQLQHSFFVDAIKGYGEEAIISLPFPIARKWQKEYIVNGDTIPSFAAAVAKKAGIDLPDSQEEYLINFSIHEPTSLKLPKRFEPGRLTNQIIIIGDVEDKRDFFIVPFTFNPNMRMAGVMIHGQITQTIMAQQWFSNISKTWMWIIALIYLWLYIGVGKCITKYLSTRPKWQWTERRAKNLWKLILTLFLIIVAYWVFWHMHRYIDVIVIILTPVMLWIENAVVSLYGISVLGVKTLRAISKEKGLKV